MVVFGQVEEQTEMSPDADWSEEYNMHLLFKKISVMHYGLHNHCNGCIMTKMVTLPDLDVMRSSDDGYSGHSNAVFREASKVACAI